MELTAQRLRELLNYDPDTGVFTRRVKTSNKVKVGDVAGHVHHSGYIQIRVLGVIQMAHRLAWLYVTGNWPINEIDHRDGCRGNNRFENLRDASKTTNMENRRAPHVSNKLGLLGVCPFRDKFRAQIQINGKKTHLGDFDTPEAAHFAYLEAKRAHHKGCTI